MVRSLWSTAMRLDLSLDERREGKGQGLQTHDERPSLGLHDRGRSPGDRFSLPYFRVPDLARALERVVELEWSVVHPGRALGNLPRLRRDPVRSRGGVIGSSAQTDASPGRGAILIRQRWVWVRRVLNAGETA